MYSYICIYIYIYAYTFICIYVCMNISAPCAGTSDQGR